MQHRNCRPSWHVEAISFAYIWLGQNRQGRRGSSKFSWTLLLMQCMEDNPVITNALCYLKNKYIAWWHQSPLQDLAGVNLYHCPSKGLHICLQLISISMCWSDHRLIHSIFPHQHFGIYLNARSSLLKSWRTSQRSLFSEDVSRTTCQLPANRTFRVTTAHGLPWIHHVWYLRSKCYLLYLEELGLVWWKWTGDQGDN